MKLETILQKQGKALSELNQLGFSEDAAKNSYNEAVEANDEQARLEAHEKMRKLSKERDKLLAKLRRYEKALNY